MAVDGGVVDGRVAAAIARYEGGRVRLGEELDCAQMTFGRRQMAGGSVHGAFTKDETRRQLVEILQYWNMAFVGRAVGWCVVYFVDSALKRWVEVEEEFELLYASLA